MKILVIQQKMIGDVLISSIICNNLRIAYPEAQIDYLIYPFTKPAVENNPNIDTIILFDDSVRKSKIAFLKFIISIRKSKYDIVIDAYSKIESKLITLFSGAPKRIGYKQKDYFNAYNIKVEHINKPKTIAGLAIERRENLFKPLMNTTPIDNHPKLFLTDSEKNEALSLLKKHDIDVQNDAVIMLSVLGSEENKTYPIPYLVEVINMIACQPNAKLLFNYMPKQLHEIQNIYNLCSEEAKNKIDLDIIGSNLRSFMGIMYYCKIIIGNDGGAVNIAKALNKPSFTIFSPWIQKESWSIFEDGNFHKAVHVNDYFPEIISTHSRKELKKNYQEYYKMLKPSVIKNELTNFLENHIK
jgi:ADP-heptose:LPS heptosyltransferase